MKTMSATDLYQTAYECTKDEIVRLSTEIGQGSRGHTKRVLQSGHAPGNFVVGDTDFIAFQDLLGRVVEKNNEIFVDLGCGRGEVMAAALLYNFRNECTNVRHVIGVELMHYKLDECIRLCQNIINLLVPCESSLPTVEYKEEDFITLDWSHASIVYACATCFSATMLSQLCDKFKLLEAGSRLILLDRELDDESLFKLLFFEKVKTSWGEGIAYVYKKRDVS